MENPTVEFVEHDDWDEYVVVFINGEEFGAFGTTGGGRWVADADLVRNLAYNRREPDLFAWGTQPYAEYAIAKRVAYLAQRGPLVKGSDTSLAVEAAAGYRTLADEHRQLASTLRALNESAAALRHERSAVEADDRATGWEELH